MAVVFYIYFVVILVSLLYGDGSCKIHTRARALKYAGYIGPKQEIVIPVMIHLDTALAHKMSKIDGYKKTKEGKKRRNFSPKTILSEVEKLYNAKSLNQRVKFELVNVKIVSNKTFDADENVSKYLRNYCRWQKTMKVLKGYPYFSVLLTGLDVYYIAKNGRKVRESTGRGFMGKMCTMDKSCTVVQWHPKDLVHLLAHEIAHSLGVYHDGTNNSCKGWYIMAPQYSREHVPPNWSTCSRTHLEEFLSNVVDKRRDASVKLTCSIHSSESQSIGMSQKFNIIGLAYVQISFKQDGTKITAEIMFQKQPIESSVRVKVISEDLECHIERICSEKENRAVMGQKYSSIMVSQYECCFFFIVTVFAYVAETTALERLYKEADTTDFHLSTTEGKVPVHKACLASRSDVFKKMLSREWKETGEGSMQLPGVTLQTLHDFKQYLYLGTLPNDGFLPLLELASCYMIKDLREMCLSKLAWNAKPEDFYSLLQYSMDNKLPELTFALIQTSPPGVVEDARRINVKENVDDEAEAQ